jgi:hypothetical protein
MYWLYLICIIGGIYRGFTRDKNSININHHSKDFFEFLYLK